MADWFRCKPTKLLRGMAGLSDDGQLAYAKALLLIYENDGRISQLMLSREFPQWRAKRLDKAVSELVATGKLFGTVGGHLHNDYAMHELQQLQEMNMTRAAAGAKGGRVRAERERQAKRIAERNRSPDLPMTMPETAPKPRQNTDKVPTKSQLSDNSAAFEIENDAELSNDFNETGQATLKHARASETETELEREPPLVSPPIETVEGEVLEPEDTPGRKQPMPPGWLPTFAGLSERVQDMVERWPQEDFEDQQTKFVEWAAATGARFVKWDRAFGNWCVKHNGQLRRTTRGKQSGWATAARG